LCPFKEKLELPNFFSDAVIALKNILVGGELVLYPKLD
jgi:hypothetical protein